MRHEPPRALSCTTAERPERRRFGDILATDKPIGTEHTCVGAERVGVFQHFLVHDEHVSVWGHPCARGDSGGLCAESEGGCGGCDAHGLEKEGVEESAGFDVSGEGERRGVRGEEGCYFGAKGGKERGLADGVAHAPEDGFPGVGVHAGLVSDAEAG